MVLTSKKQSFMQAKQSSKISEHVPVDASPRSLVGSSSTSLSTLFLRPALGVGMSLLYGYYLDNRIFASNKEMMRAGILGGSIFASNMVGNVILPAGFLPKLNGQRDMSNMAVEAVVTGLLYSGGVYFLVDAQTSELIPQFVKGGAIDLGAGAGSALVTPYVPF